MRVLLDENMPADLSSLLTPHEARTVPQMGWAGTKNGALLERASGQFEAFVTMDIGLSYQQSLQRRPFGVVMVRAFSNRMEHLRPLALPIIEALDGIEPGELRFVGAA